MYSLPGSSVYGILQLRILEWVAILSPENLPDQNRIGSPELQMNSLPSESPGKPSNSITSINISTNNPPLMSAY